MLSVDDYLARILDSVAPLDVLELPLSAAQGCVLAEDVSAPWPLPSFDNSSMDGYAVRAEDIARATEESPISLAVIDDVPAGRQASEEVRPGTAIRIMTGAPVPVGADAVVPVERTDAGTEVVRITAAVDSGAYIRRAGEDVGTGDAVLRHGTLIGARQMAILAAVGSGHVRVHPQPRVAVISTGSELVDPGTPLTHGFISDSNSYLLVAACREAGADAYRVGPVPDDEEAFLTAVEDQLHRCDLLLTSGGVSMGAYDTVKAVLSQLGSVDFMKVAMNPGMPQGHGHVGQDRVPIITLPGNPVSSYISFENFVRPAIRRMRGLTDLHRPRLRLRAAAELTSPSGKRQYARAVILPTGEVAPVGAGQGSHVLGGLAVADALIVVPEDVTVVEVGDEVEVVDLRG